MRSQGLGQWFERQAKRFNSRFCWFTIFKASFARRFHVLVHIVFNHLHCRVAESWQAFGERQKMPSILSSNVYLLICDKKVVSARNTKTATKTFFAHVVANTWGHFLIFLQGVPCRLKAHKAQTRALSSA